MGQYDRTMKLLVDSNPEAMVRFVLHELQKQTGFALAEMKITAVTQLSGEFQSEELDGDNVLLVEGADGPFCLAEIEFQSRLHPYMPLRSLEYCARAKKKHWQLYADLPIVAVVIYLFDEEGMPEPPLRWSGPDGETTMIFNYLSIKLKELSREDLLSLHQPALWPLILLTEGRVDRIMVGEMFTELIEQKLYTLLPIGHTIAGWLLRGDDLNWLSKEYAKMYDLFKDSPAIQWMEESAIKTVSERIRKEEREKADQRVFEERVRASEEREKAAQRILEERIRASEDREKAAQKVLEERAKVAEEHKKMVATLATFRGTVVELVSQRFPKLKRLAKAQVRTLEQPELFQQLILRLSLARDLEEAQDILFALHEDEDEEIQPSTGE